MHRAAHRSAAQQAVLEAGFKEKRLERGKPEQQAWDRACRRIPNLPLATLSCVLGKFYPLSSNSKTSASSSRRQAGERRLSDTCAIRLQRSHRPWTGSR